MRRYHQRQGWIYGQMVKSLSIIWTKSDLAYLDVRQVLDGCRYNLDSVSRLDFVESVKQLGSVRL